MKNSGIPHAQNGFNLTELMIVVAVVGILAAIAYPNYTASVDKSRRADAQVSLMTAAQTLERCYTMQNNYTECGFSDGDTFDSDEAFYRITVTSIGTQTYTLTATPQNAQERDEDDCATFTLDQAGRQGATGEVGDDCWG